MDGFGLVPDVRRIAVLRANVLGDFVFCVPALRALRRAYPDAELVLLGRQWHVEFLAGRSLVDTAVAVPPAPGILADDQHRPDPVQLEEFFSRMRQERFDVAIQLHGGGGNSNPFVACLGSRLTVGLRDLERGAPPLDRWIPYVYYQSEIARYLEVVSLIGAQPVELDPVIDVLPRDLQEADQVLSPGRQPLVALHPGATDPRRRWSPGRFAAVGDALAGAGAKVVVTGSTQEQGLVDAVLGGMRRPVESLCGRLSVSGLAGLLSRCAVVVANDTGPLHLAAAVGAATVGIFWCGNLITAGPLTRRRNRPQVSWRLDCPACGLDCTRHRCPHEDSFVDDVGVEEVATAALDLLSVQAEPYRGAPCTLERGKSAQSAS